MKFYAIASDQAEAIKNCHTGKYTNQPFWPDHKTLVPYLERAREENPGVSLRIWVIKVGG
ncbi:hypothetical protein PP459_gp101 [Streptomyces phage Wakanda]|uniref:Uncharacterized protein n=2 Tax=Wakandavirus TaxID=3044854 RepID=A0A6G8R3B9_9CAUD|nr:hypothetical protein PP459_gp101 [Streptomyces phage Wakanda]YP_010652453.1 hypothetical protein PP460_gp105 [Streptomyces phage Muntaha]QIN94132.1 hypothetical protein SEA_WAKANDA_170 [Streptomyces phage Wakanda]QIN94697.1 hypothetical protein SEA_MUNTAHA_172 [Streptomyces phage Muntaha]